MSLLVTEKLYATAGFMAAILFPDDERAQAQCRDAALRALNHDPLPGERPGWRPGTRLVVV